MKKKNLTIKILLASAVLLSYSNLRCDEEATVDETIEAIASEFFSDDSDEDLSALESMKSCDANIIEIAFEVERGEGYDPELWERVLDQFSEFSKEFSNKAGLSEVNRSLAQQVVAGALTEATKVILVHLFTQLYQVIKDSVATSGNLRVSVLNKEETPEEVAPSEDKAIITLRYNRDDNFDVWDSMFENLREQVSQIDSYESSEEESLSLIENILDKFDSSTKAMLTLNY